MDIEVPPLGVWIETVLKAGEMMPSLAPPGGLWVEVAAIILIIMTVLVVTP
jgi:hypothetical protein